MSDESMQPLSVAAGVGIAGFLLAVVGWLMPWVDHRVATETVSIQGDEIEGFRLLVLAVPAAACLWLTTIKRLNLIMASAATVLAAVICVIDFVWIGEITSAPDAAEPSRFVGEQLIGSKITMLGAAVALCGSCTVMLVSLRRRGASLAARLEIARRKSA